MGHVSLGSKESLEGNCLVPRGRGFDPPQEIWESKVGGHSGSENKFIRFESALSKITITGLKSQKNLLLSSATFLPSTLDSLLSLVAQR
jgi:hypothetical protein